MERLLSLLGVPALIFIGWLVLSTDRRHFPWRVVLWGVGLQIGFAMLILWTPGGRAVFAFLGDITTKFLSYSNAGAEFLFGNIVKEEYQQTFGFQFAFAILPTIIFVGAVMSIGYHLGILQRIVKGVAWVMTRTMGTSGAESLSNAVNIFVGQTEAPLVIRPFLKSLTKSELNAVMVGGFAGIAGGVMAGYILIGIPAKHLLAACVMCAPASFVFAKIAVPERETAAHRGQGGNAGDPQGFQHHRRRRQRHPRRADSRRQRGRDAHRLHRPHRAAQRDPRLGFAARHLCRVSSFSLQPARYLQSVFAPLGFIVGVPWAEMPPLRLSHRHADFASTSSSAYIELSKMIKAGILSERTITLASYALCGFCNFSSIAIQIGGIAALVPERRSRIGETRPARHVLRQPRLPANRDHRRHAHPLKKAATFTVAAIVS